MRIAVFLLLAATAVPALAEPLERQERRFDRIGTAREAPAERSERALPTPRAAREAVASRSAPADRASAREALRAGLSQRGREPLLGRRGPAELNLDRTLVERPERPAAGFARRLERADRPSENVSEIERPAPGPRVIDAPGIRRRSGDSVADWRLRDRGAGRAPELVQEGSGSIPDSMRDRRQRHLDRLARDGESGGFTSPVVSREPREGTQPTARTEPRPERYSRIHWRGDWRRDRRYDWSHWRRKHRSRFRLGFYFDPFGWSYHRYHVGWRLWPSYYSSSYWLHDPWHYRLPYAPSGYRWVRYYDDALLVDLWSGEVVDVIHNFFW